MRKILPHIVKRTFGVGGGFPRVFYEKNSFLKDPVGYGLESTLLFLCDSSGEEFEMGKISLEFFPSFFQSDRLIVQCLQPDRLTIFSKEVPCLYRELKIPEMDDISLF